MVSPGNTAIAFRAAFALTDEGREMFTDAAARLIGREIGVCMDGERISAASSP